MVCGPLVTEVDKTENAIANYKTFSFVKITKMMFLEAYLSRDVLRESVSCGTVLGQSCILIVYSF